MSRVSFKKSSRSGFTILEMIVSLALLSLIIGLPIGIISRGGGKVEIESAMRGMCRALRATHSISIATNRDAVFMIDKNRNSYLSNGDHEVFLPSSILMRVNSGRYGLQNNSHSSITFFPDSTSSGGDITLENSKVKGSISINWLTSEVSCSLV